MEDQTKASVVEILESSEGFRETVGGHEALSGQVCVDINPLGQLVRLSATGAFKTDVNSRRLFRPFPVTRIRQDPVITNPVLPDPLILRPMAGEAFEKGATPTDGDGIERQGPVKEILPKGDVPK